MNKTLIALYDRFYIPPGMDQDKVEIEEAHQLLIERLDKPRAQTGAENHRRQGSNCGESFRG